MPAALALLVLAGCATPVYDDAQLDAALRRAATTVPGLRGDYALVALNADDEMDAWSQAAKTRAEGPSPLARTLAPDFERAARGPVHYVVGGPYEPLVRSVLLDALALVRAPRLPGLLLVVVTPEPPHGALLEAALDLEARVVYRELAAPAD